MGAFLAPGFVLAQVPIEITDQHIEVDFPELITFHLSVSAPSPIVGAELRYRVHQLSCGSLVATALPEFDSSPSVEIDWEWELLERGGLPVGATVTYWWVVEDEAGNVVETPEATLVFDDPRFEWRTLEGEFVTLHWVDGDEGFAQELLSIAEDGIDRLHASTGVAHSRQVQVYIYGSASAMLGALAFAQEWTGGVSFSDYGLISIGVNPSNLAWGRTAMMHELSHVVVREASFACGAELAAWLDEGIAVMNEGDQDPLYERIMEDAIDQDSVFALRSLGGDFPYDAQEARLAYVQSQSFVDYLMTLQGTEGLSAVLAAFRESGSTDRALEEAFGFDQEGLDRRWREWIGLPVREPEPTLSVRVRPIPTINLRPPEPEQPQPQAPEATPTLMQTPAQAPASGGSGCNSSDIKGAGVDVAGLGLLLGLGLVLTRRRFWGGGSYGL
jgi:hypothetical protein